MASVVPLLKKYYLENYRPNSFLSFLSKLTERVAKLRLTHHLSSNNLPNSFQLVCTKHYSTESTFLPVQNHIIEAMNQQVTCFLDRSAAFDTIDHPIFIHRLSSWFHFSGTVLFWLQSYLSSRDINVNIKL